MVGGELPVLWGLSNVQSLPQAPQARCDKGDSPELLTPHAALSPGPAACPYLALHYGHHIR